MYRFLCLLQVLFTMVLRHDHLINDHASFSRRNIAPAPNRAPPTVGRSLRIFHILQINALLISSPSRVAARGYHPSPRKAIACSLATTRCTKTFCTSHSSISLISPHIQFLVVQLTFSGVYALTARMDVFGGNQGGRLRPIKKKAPHEKADPTFF